MAKVRWHAKNNCWTASLGERDKRGRRLPIYKPFAGIPAGEAGRRAAQRIADEIAAQEQQIATSSLSVEELVNLFLESTKHKKRPGTDLNHQRLLQSFCNFKPTALTTRYGLRAASTIHVGELQVMVDTWHREQKSATYISHLVSTVRQTFAWAAKRVPGRQPEQLLPPTDVGQVERPKIRVKPVAYTTRKEVAQFLRFVWRHINNGRLTYPNDRCSACYFARRPGPCRRVHHETAYTYREVVLLMRFAAHTGCRPGEVRELEWSEIKWDQSLAVLYKGKKWMRTGKPRVIIIPPIMLRALRRHYDRGPRDGRWCFTHLTRANPGETKPPRMVWTDCDLASRIRFWRKAAKQAKVIENDKGPLRIHLLKLRHASVTDALQAGIATPLVAELHGTSERMIEATYSHVQITALKNAARQLEAGRRPPKVD